ncbi:MAG TPA: PLP-dependent aminotransferase family protein [Verrucomicrobiae bacterium]|nr:PLP-dependent aminotransferase family protein [Verrucomicrobiae bacterium]
MKRTASGFSPLIFVDRKAGKPLQSQVCDALRAAVVSRNLRAGERIPSTRSLAAELGISRITVLNAYSQLLAEGYFESRVGAGTFVSSSLPGQAARSEAHSGHRASEKRAPRPVARRCQQIPKYERPVWVSGQGAFSLSQAAVEELPFRAWSKLVTRYWRKVRLSGLQYGDPMGLRELREAIGAYLRAARSVRCEWQQIMIVSGSQQALDISARVLLEAGDPVWMEEPGYWLAKHMLASAGCRLVGVPVDNDGLHVAAGMERCRKARAAYVAPSHQFPMGATMSASRRLQLLEWAQSAGAWIVEDDYDSEYRYDSKPIASLQGLDRTGRVIYVGTFSKVMFPSLRVGYIVIPADLVDHFTAVRHAMDVSPAHQYQAVLAEFINEGHFSRHIRRMRQTYHERRVALVEGIRKELGSLLEMHGADAGLHLTVTLPRGYRDREISGRAAGESLWLWPLSPMYSGPGARQGFILGFGGTTVGEIPGAVKRLREFVTRGSARR